MDYLIRGMARNDKVRIIGCDCKDTIGLICKKHGTYPIATIALGRFLCATLMMGAMNAKLLPRKMGILPLVIR